MPSLTNTEEHRQQVQQRTQDYLSGRRPRDPDLSSMSTGRLILEAMLEAVKIYRMQQEERVRQQTEERTNEHRGRRRRRRHHRHDNGRGNDLEHRARSQSRDRHIQMNNEGRRTSRDGHRGRRRRRDIPDPVTEGQPDLNREYMVTGGAGPAQPAEPPDHHSNTVTNLPIRQYGPSTKPSQAGITDAPTQRVGPDRRTPFGELPAKREGDGFLKHAVNTYRHIKAEHEAGHRMRGVVEKKIDDLRRAKKGSGDERATLPTRLKRTEKSKSTGDRDIVYEDWVQRKQEWHNGEHDESRGSPGKEKLRGRENGKQKPRFTKSPHDHDACDAHWTPGHKAFPPAPPQIPAIVFETPPPPSPLHQIETARTLYQIPKERALPPQAPLGVYTLPEPTDEPPSPKHVPMPSAQDYLPPSPSLPPTSSPPTPIDDDDPGPQIAVLRASPARKPVVHSAAESIRSRKTATTPSKPSINIRKLDSPRTRSQLSDNTPLYQETSHSQAVKAQELAEATGTSASPRKLSRRPETEIQKKISQQWENRAVSEGSLKPAYEATSHSHAVEDRERKQTETSPGKKTVARERPVSELQKQVRKKWQDQSPGGTSEESALNEPNVLDESISEAFPIEEDAPSSSTATTGSPSWDWGNLGKKK